MSRLLALLSYSSSISLAMLIFLDEFPDYSQLGASSHSDTHIFGWGSPIFWHSLWFRPSCIGPRQGLASHLPFLWTVSALSSPERKVGEILKSIGHLDKELDFIWRPGATPDQSVTSPNSLEWLRFDWLLRSGRFLGVHSHVRSQTPKRVISSHFIHVRNASPWVNMQTDTWGCGTVRTSKSKVLV